MSAPVLVYLMVAVAVAMLALLLQRQAGMAQQNQAVLMELQEQNDAIRAVLERQDRNDADRQRLIDDAVARIAAEQYRALVAHDRRTEELIRRNGRLLDREVNSPANQEQRPETIIPMPAPAPRPAPEPRVGPSTGVAPEPALQPAPAPQPAPCRQRGKSGKCKR